MESNSRYDEGIYCTIVCWMIALVAAILAGYMLMALGGVSFAGAIFVGLILFGVGGWALASMVCGIGATDGAAATMPVARPMSAPTAAPSPTAAPAATAAAPAPSAAPAPTVAASAPLAGEADLASRKGAWAYGKEGANGKDYDGDGVAEGPSEGVKPETLTAARDGQPDDLKQIKGVGPKLEGLLHRLGFFHFDQVANWTADEVAWVDANLEGFKGRVSRDDWVAQAKILADGGTTAFAKKVAEGEVYD